MNQSLTALFNARHYIIAGVKENGNKFYKAEVAISSFDSDVRIYFLNFFSIFLFFVF